MRTKNTALLTGFFISAVMLTACSTSPQTISVSGQSGYDSGVSTSGEGTVKAVPDMAEITFSVYSEGADAKTVKDKNSEDNNRVIDFLKSEGFSDESISTLNLGMNPVYDYSSGSQIVKGYEMETEIKVSDIELSKLGDIIDASVDNGINSIQSIDYFVSDYDEQYSEALKLAVDDARAKAETLAEAGGVEIGDVTVISEYGADTSAKYVNGLTNYSAKSAAAAEDMSAAPGSAMIMPGQLEIKANVSMSFEVKMP